MPEQLLHPPFGSKVERFSTLGYHPRLETRPGTYKSSKLSPGCYAWERPRRIISKVPSWKKQQKVAEFAQRLAYVGDHILRRRQWMNTINGPGWQDVPALTLNQGICLSRALRFPEPKMKSYAVPGPGTYGKFHVPYTRKEEKDKSKGFSFSTLSSFEQYSKAPRSMINQPSYHLPPNLYKIKNATQELLNKVVSKRGPYDLLTGERFPDQVFRKRPILRQRIHPSDLNHPKNAFKGIFMKCGKESIVTARLALTRVTLCRKNPRDPAPNHYDPFPTPVVPQSAAPFGCSREARPSIKCGFSAPPGRYNHEFKKNIIGDGMKSAFLSKVKRALPQPEKMSWFE